MFTRDFFSEGWGLLFALCASASRDPEWKLSEDEAHDLAQRTDRLVRTVDKKKLQKLEKKYGKYVPAGSLVLGVGALVVPRIRHTAHLRKLARVAIQEETGDRGANPAGAPRASGPAVPVVPVDGNRNGDLSGASEILAPVTQLATRPIRREDGPLLGLDD